MSKRDGTYRMPNRLHVCDAGFKVLISGMWRWAYLLRVVARSLTTLSRSGHKTVYLCIQRWYWEAP